MIQDFKFALRQLFKAPRFTIAAVVVLALGIGANTAIFSLVRAMLFAPIVLAVADLLATWLPARRATRISPMSARRTE